MRTLLVTLLVAVTIRAADLSHAMELVVVWQHRLGLTAWQVSIGFAAASDLKGAGEVHYSLQTMQASIRLLDPATVSPLADVQANYAERIVVHELVHLALVPIKGASGEALRREDERAVKHITDALLASQASKVCGQ